MDRIDYSEKYYDDTFEYRHVTLPRELARHLPRNRLLSETECRAIGVQQSSGWIHYDIHRPEPHIMLFRRPLNYQQLLQQQEEEEQLLLQQMEEQLLKQQEEEQQLQQQQLKQEEDEQNRRRKRMRGEDKSASEGADDQMPTK